MFLGPYDLRIYVTDECFMDIGAGSLGCIERLTTLHAPPGFSGCIGTIGRFCEFAASAEVMGRSDHDHDQPVNISFRLLRDLGGITSDLGMKPMKPFNIGHGVVLSSGAKVLPGVKVGDGAVVGAGSIVTRDVEPFTIVAGSPAKALRRRAEFAPWWDFAFDYLIELGDGVQDAARSGRDHSWRDPSPRIVLRHSGSNYSIEGFTEGNGVRPMSEAPERVSAYITQAFTPGRSYLMPDCWA